MNYKAVIAGHDGPMGNQDYVAIVSEEIESKVARKIKARNCETSCETESTKEAAAWTHQ
ncbi:hypothetical protein M404DRAFT_994372 [Pisolithus tinctorius Marx 270]|uniref:Uncharacterized protein n=1 Tax=Pisolithus tinctorius Marx 270 TaxID=870435 RepID=A0A0C3PRE5_PISTI|nr:hypothetical protein M404DRAFT_994372 [Pisolithus tinctorius Marx 270]